MNIRKLLSTLLIVLTPLFANANLIVDNFEDPQGPLYALVGETITDSVLGNGILGGERDITVTTYSSMIPGLGAKIGVSGSTFAFNADAGVESSFTIVYDGIDGSSNINTAGLADQNGNGIDLTNGGQNTTFATDILFADTDFWWSVELWWANGTESEKLMLPGIEDEYDGFGEFTSNLPFSYFSFADLTDISAIAIEGNILTPAGYLGAGTRATSFDVALSGITAVPEPDSIMLLGLGCLLIGLAGRRRTKKVDFEHLG